MIGYRPVDIVIIGLIHMGRIDTLLHVSHCMNLWMSLSTATVITQLGYLLPFYCVTWND